MVILNAKAIKLSNNEEIVPSEWKEHNIVHFV